MSFRVELCIRLVSYEMVTATATFHRVTDLKMGGETTLYEKGRQAIRGTRPET